MDQLGAELDREAGEIAISPDATADAIARFKHDSFDTGFAQMPGGGKPGDARPNDQRFHRARSGSKCGLSQTSKTPALPAADSST